MIQLAALGCKAGNLEDAMLAGISQAESLYRSVRDDPGLPLSVAIVGPGGSGKSATLSAVASAYRSAGVSVVGPHQAVAEVASVRGAAVLVDDAHELDTQDLDRLRMLVEADDVRLFVAYRPRPRQPALTRLVAAIRRCRPPVTLRHLDRAGVEARAAKLLRARPLPALVDLLVEQTGGLPSLIDLVVEELQENGDVGTNPDAAILLGRVIELLCHDLDYLDAGVQRLMLAIAVGSTVDTEVLAATLAIEPDACRDRLDEACATGLLLPGGSLVTLARTAILTATPAEHRHTMQRKLLKVQLPGGGGALALARALASAGVQDAEVAGTLQAAGDEALRTSPALAVELFAQALTAGASAAALNARRAEAAALTGDLDGALQLADQVVSDLDSPELVRGITVAGAVLAHRGLLARSAELYRWVGQARPGALAPLAAIALIGTGAISDAEQVLKESDSSRPPTLLAGAESLMARGVQESLTGGSPAAALSTLTRAAAMLGPAGRAVVLPDTPAALAALVALHCGELDVAESVLERAVATDLGGPLAVPRHHLLLGWTAMMRGNTAGACARLRRAAEIAGEFEPRDELFATALQVGLALRTSDIPALIGAWSRAREAIVRHPVDLFALLPLGELAVAGARLRESDRVTPHLDEAGALLKRLGEPVLWGTPLHWSGVHVAILAEQPAALEPHAKALVRAARSSPYAAVLARAGRAWEQVLIGRFDAEAVETAARALQAVGLGWDGARLAGQAAVRTKDRKTMSSLLACARALQVAAPDAPSTSQVSGAPPAARGASSVVLSEREREVAALVLDNLTYRQVGERLFISAKTVEHHMARIRQRVGGDNRAELLARLRALLAKDRSSAVG